MALGPNFLRGVHSDGERLLEIAYFFTANKETLYEL
jgi:hypothetical protein